jgi:hypothetical protein
MPPIDITSIKRKFDDMENLLQFAGPGVKALIVKRLPQQQPKTSNDSKVVKKLPPIPIKMLIFTEAYDLDVMEKDLNGVYGAAAESKTIKKGETVWFKDFDIPNEAVAGSIVLVNNPKGNLFNESFNLKGKIKVLEKATYQKLFAEVNNLTFELPKIEDIKKYDDIYLAVGLTKFTNAALIWGRNDEKIYINNKKTPPVLGAWIDANKGYPCIVKNQDTNKEYCVILKFYDNALQSFGVVDVKKFSRFAPLYFEKFIGFIHCTIDFLNTQDSADDYEYVVTANVGSIYLDLAAIVKSIGFEVSDQYVKDRFDNDMLVESEHAHKNPLYVDRATTNVICLHEFTGKISNYFNGLWKFYSVVDIDLDDAFSNDVMALRNEASFEKIEASLKAFQDSGYASKTSVVLEYEYEYIFAVKI